MSISSVSAYAQLQNWHTRQKSVTDDLLGSNSDSTTADYSSAFSNVSANFYAGMANVAAQAALARVQDEFQSKYSSDSVDLTAGTDKAKAAGNAILAQLGLQYSASSSSSSSSSSDTYTAPINSATGYSYIKTSAASVNNLNALNLFA